ncbi:MAG TPA: hypothetical protein VLC09_10135 [Polyangiaceae bacterium]|nr:hypothetical protein [Polyangiaceae bacterium]
MEAKAPAPPPLCPTGLSEDPPRAAQDEGIRAFERQEYTQAQAFFGDLAHRYPGSAAARVWLGDSVLFDKGREDRAAAEAARPIYAEAARLHQAGCKLQRRPRYYLLMGQAYAALRLAKLQSGYEPTELDQADQALTAAAAEFPTSAEVPYNQARVACARVQQGAPGGLGPCLTSFERALVLAQSLDRPRFLRTHRSTQDWIVRSRNQSEFGPLRSDPAYRTLIDRTLAGEPG